MKSRDVCVNRKDTLLHKVPSKCSGSHQTEVSFFSVTVQGGWTGSAPKSHIWYRASWAARRPQHTSSRGAPVLAADLQPGGKRGPLGAKAEHVLIQILLMLKFNQEKLDHRAQGSLRMIV